MGPDNDVLHYRDEFSLTRVSAIIAAAASGPLVEGLGGRQRALLYAFCSCTGFRSREAPAIRKCFFAPDFSSVSLSSEHTKNRKRANQPIPPGPRGPRAEFAGGFALDALLWSMEKVRCAADFLRVDTLKAGIVIGREGKEANGGRVLDFHSLRHTYNSNLERAGIGDGMRQRLSRATSGIVQHYTHRDDSQLEGESLKLLIPDLSVLGISPGIS